MASVLSRSCRRSESFSLISYLFKHFLPPSNHVFKRKILLHEPPPGFCDPLQVWGAQRPLYIRRDALRGVILHNKSSLPVYYNIRYRPDRCREHRGHAGHRIIMNCGIRMCQVTYLQSPLNSIYYTLHFSRLFPYYHSTSYPQVTM